MTAKSPRRELMPNHACCQPPDNSESMGADFHRRQGKGAAPYAPDFARDRAGRHTSLYRESRPCAAFSSSKGIQGRAGP